MPWREEIGVARREHRRTGEDDLSIRDKAIEGLHLKLVEATGRATP